MRKLNLITLFLLISVAGISQNNKYVKISKQKVEDKVKGAWAGKMIGVSCGIVMEFASCGETFKGDINWEPKFVEKSLIEDDIYGQMCFMQTMERCGLEVSVDSLAKDFANAGFSLCHANLQGRKNYMDGIPVSLLATPENSIHAEDLDFQIECDFIGFINPGMPYSSNKLCEKVGSIMSSGDGMYAGMFLAAMHSLAYVDNNIESIINKALLAIPQESDYAACIRQVITDYNKNPKDWTIAWQNLQNKWGQNDKCSPFIPFNIDAKLNGAYIVLGLLYGKTDVKKTMEITIRCGQDTDCNASNGLAVLCLMKGYKAIPKVYTEFIPQMADKNFIYTNYSFNKVVKQTIAFIEENIIKNGGKIEGDTYYIKEQKPVAPKFDKGLKDLEMAYQVEIAQSDKWTFDTNWEPFTNGGGDEAPYKVSVRPGATMQTEFEGTGVALLGSWNVDGGKAMVYIDGKPIKEINGYYHSEAGKFLANRAYIFHKLGLKSGKHTLTVVVLDDKDARSKGNRIYIERMLIYK